jgi:hypothetical protein
MLKYLRISVTALSLTVCVLLIALWMRSYRVNEVKAFTVAGTRFHVQSLLGRVVLGRASNSVTFRQPVTDSLREGANKRDNILGFSYYRARFGDLVSVRIPIWFLATTFAALSILPWIPRRMWRFRLRTLLITVTLIATMLGIAESAGRKTAFELPAATTQVAA